MRHDEAVKGLLKGFQHFRSCHVGDTKYSIGDFVVLEGIPGGHAPRIARIEAVHDKGDTFDDDERFIASVTLFLGHSEVPNVLLDCKELLMDMSRTEPYIVNVSCITSHCKVVLIGDLENGDKDSFFYNWGYDGFSKVKLSRRDIRSKYNYTIGNSPQKSGLLLQQMEALDLNSTTLRQTLENPSKHSSRRQKQSVTVSTPTSAAARFNGITRVTRSSRRILPSCQEQIITADCDTAHEVSSAHKQHENTRKSLLPHVELCPLLMDSPSVARKKPHRALRNAAEAIASTERTINAAAGGKSFMSDTEAACFLSDESGHSTPRKVRKNASRADNRQENASMPVPLSTGHPVKRKSQPKSLIAAVCYGEPDDEVFFNLPLQCSCAQDVQSQLSAKAELTSTHTHGNVSASSLTVPTCPAPSSVVNDTEQVSVSRRQPPKPVVPRTCKPSKLTRGSSRPGSSKTSVFLTRIKDRGQSVDEAEPTQCVRRTPGRKAKSTIDYRQYLDPFLASDDSDRDSSFEPRDAELPKKSFKVDLSDIVSQKARPFATPRSRGRKLTATPGMPTRCQPLCSDLTNLQRARMSLHVSVVPDSLPCREDEFANIMTYVQSKLCNGTGGCLYISGVPGTGKTATVYEVMRCLAEARDKQDLPPYRFIEVNGMRLTDPHQAYVKIYKDLTGNKATADHATALLDKMFASDGRKETIILLVDELDLLMTRKQDVLYNLFDWPTKLHSKLIVLAIANTMDLPERVMINRVASRLGLNRMTFQPYTFQQLQEIVNSRLSDMAVFDPDAIQLASRKVAAVSGDARRALDICRRATEVAELKGENMVCMSDVDAVLQEMFSSPKITAIRSCTLYEKLTLRAVLAEFQRSGLEEATLQQVYRHVPAVCQLDRVPVIKMAQMLRICANLSSIKIMLIEANGTDIYQRLRLNVGQDDVQYALREEHS